jgi:hypothetical protein
MSYSIPVFTRPFLLPEVVKIDNAVIEIRMGSDFVDFKVLPRPTTKDAALRELRLCRERHVSDCFRLRLEDWNTGTNEIVEV